MSFIQQHYSMLHEINESCMDFNGRKKWGILFPSLNCPTQLYDFLSLKHSDIEYSFSFFINEGQFLLEILLCGLRNIGKPTITQRHINCILAYSSIWQVICGIMGIILETCSINVQARLCMSIHERSSVGTP